MGISLLWDYNYLSLDYKQNCTGKHTKSSQLNYQKKKKKKDNSTFKN